MNIIHSAEVCLSNGRIVSWTWERDPVQVRAFIWTFNFFSELFTFYECQLKFRQMKALCCGLGMIGIILSVTLKCINLHRQEVI